VTLRDAHYETGLPVETLRKWARRNHVPSEVRVTEHGERRVVDLVAVEERAKSLGRVLRPIAEDERVDHVAEPAAPSPATAVVDIRNEAPRAATDATPSEADPSAAGEAAAEPVPTSTPVDPMTGAADAVSDAGAASDAAAGTMIVPIAAWDRILMQLGNLHEAGQQLAEARERAAKAETEARFLRERLAEMRASIAPPPPEAPIAANATAAQEPPEAQEPPQKMWRYVLQGWRDRRK
jgi:hypothetical protein